MSVMSKVYLVGAGPGDPNLLTRRAEHLLYKADVVLYDRLVNPFILQLTRPDAQLINVGKIPYHPTMKQEEINQQLIASAEKHGCVVRLKGGDPAIFGRLQEEVEALERENIDYEVVPGVTSASAAVATLSIGLTSRRLSNSVTYCTGQAVIDTPERFVSMMQQGTLAIYMGIKRIGQIMSTIQQETDVDYPVNVIFQASYEREQVIKGHVSTIASQVEDSDVDGPGLILIGPVLDLEKMFNTKVSTPELLQGNRTANIARAFEIYEEGRTVFLDIDPHCDYHPSQLALIQHIKETLV